MKHFVVYLDNGQILKTGYCSESDFDLQGKNVIEGFADDSMQYVENGVIINMPPKPNGACYFDFDLKQWVLNNSEQQTIVRQKRDELLYKSDWTQLVNNPLSAEKQQEWAIYRQQLRDITQQSGYPFNVVWPTKPE